MELRLSPALLAVALCFGLSAVPAIADTVRVASSAPYAEDAEIASKIRSECIQLQTQLPAPPDEVSAILLERGEWHGELTRRSRADSESRWRVTGSCTGRWTAVQAQ